MSTSATSHEVVLIGLGEVVGDRDDPLSDPREPLDRIAAAVELAIRDSGVDDAVRQELAGMLDAVVAVRTTSWAHAETAATVARRIGAAPGRLVDTTVGGHHPVRELDVAAARIAAGEDRVALLVGGESQATVTAASKAGMDPAADLGWSLDPGGPPAFDPADLGAPLMVGAGVVLPTRVYPLLHSAVAAAMGWDGRELLARSARTFADLSAVAADHPMAWAPTARTAEDVATPGPGNRVVCEPYTLAMNAMPHVDQAVAVLLASVEAADALGIPPERRVAVRGGAGASDLPDVLARPDLGRSRAIEAAFDATLDRLGLEVADLGSSDGAGPGLPPVDVYSCFPVVPHLVAAHLGTGERVLSATGGHAAFGGPLSSYSLHAVATVARRLRDRSATVAVHANGGYLTEQHVVVLTSAPGRTAYLGAPDPQVLTDDGAPPFVGAADLLADAEDQRHGVEVTVEAVTVEHDRSGGPGTAIVVARTADGRRTASTTPPGDPGAAAGFSLGPPFTADESGDGGSAVGRRVRIVATDGGARVLPA